jgi:hypothetical protein
MHRMGHVNLERNWERRMLKRLVVLAALSSSSMAFAETPTPAHDPSVDNRNVNGVPLTFSVQDFSNSSENPRFVIDYSDLKNKAVVLAGRVALPNNNCANYRSDNAVVSPSQLTVDARDGKAVFLFGGSFSVWDCRENPIPNTVVEWGFVQVGPIKTKVPKVKTIPGDPIKTLLAKSTFSVQFEFRLDIHGDIIVIVPGKQDILDDASLQAYPSGGTAFIMAVLKPTIDFFQNLMDPNVILAKAISKPAKSRYKGSEFLNEGGKLLANIYLMPQ